MCIRDRVIAEQMNGFYFITKWPLSLKPFYIQPDEDPKYSKGFDFMYINSHSKHTAMR